MGGSVSAFQSLCSRLQENDPDVVVVNTDHFPFFDPGVAQQLGVALENNHFVERLLLDLSNLAVQGPEDGVTRIASFFRTSKTLRSVQLKSHGLATVGVYLCPTQRVDVATVLAVFLAALAENDSICEVQLSDLDLSLPCREFLRFLTSCHPNLKRMRLSHGRSVEPSEMTSIMNAFAQNETLTGLELTDVPESVWGACLAGITMNETLHDLSLNRLSHYFDQGPLNHLVETNTCIRSLSISQSSFESVENLATSLQRNRHIVDLMICHCSFSVYDAVHLKRIVRDCTTVSRLNLSGNCLRTAGLKLISEGLFRNRTLFLLDLSDNELSGVEACRTMGNLLRRNRGLKRLDLDHNNWFTDDESSMLFAEGLARNQSLISLDLSASHLNDRDVGTLADIGLRTNESLRELVLNANHLGPPGLYTLLGAVQDSMRIHSLRLNNNHLSDEGGMFLAQALRNTSCPLRKLSFNHNPMNDETLREILVTLETNERLEFLSFEEQLFGTATMEALCRALKINSTLKSIYFTFHMSEWTEMWYETRKVNIGLSGEVETIGFVAETPLAESKLDFYTRRNRCLSLTSETPTFQHGGIWGSALRHLLQESKHSNVYFVLRDHLPNHCLGRDERGRKRPAQEQLCGCGK